MVQLFAQLVLIDLLCQGDGSAHGAPATTRIHGDRGRPHVVLPPQVIVKYLCFFCPQLCTYILLIDLLCQGPSRGRSPAVSAQHVRGDSGKSPVEPQQVQGDRGRSPAMSQQVQGDRGKSPVVSH